ncbi:MAG: ribonuclease P protein component [Tidjanibacter sp.]|nr:ribonuclease P protein component [Tidjanibacter sp.]
MAEEKRYGLRKAERLHGGAAVDALFVRNKSGLIYPFRYIYKLREATPEDEAQVSVLFVVPKRNIKRAVGRNLLKRRMREAYRTQKLPIVARATEQGKHLDLGLIYTTKEILDFNTIRNAIGGILEKVTGKI